jgi:hypothetical protein
VSYNPFRQIVKRLFVELRRIRQPMPDVTEEDVFRIVRLDFPEQFDVAMAVLNQYGLEKWEREQARVRIAILKLVNGDPEKLKQAIETAKRDYRDVLAAAEYPEYFRSWGRAGLSRRDAKRFIDADWLQYETWLRK